MNRRSFLAQLCQFVLSAGFLGRFLRSSIAQASASSLTRIAFGSCLRQDQPQPIWPAIEKARPELFVFLGDNIYADTEDMTEMKGYYKELDAHPGFAKFRKATPVVGTWDDHDYGENDGGADYPMKKESKELMLDFFREPASSPRRQRDGVYTSYFYGQAPNRLQVILLDLRTFRTALERAEGEGHAYVPSTDPNSTMVGAEQFKWLEEQLREPADLRILGSSVQLVSSEHRWEKWGNYPSDKRRFYELLDRLSIRNLFVLSGDMHFSEFSSEKTPGGLEVRDHTCSGLNVKEEVEGITNSKRLFYKDDFAHFGLLKIDWKEAEVMVRFETRGIDGKAVFRRDEHYPR